MSVTPLAAPIWTAIVVIMSRMVWLTEAYFSSITFANAESKSF